MNRLNLKVLFVGVMFSTSIYFTACKSKPKEADTTTVTTADTTTVAPVPEPAPIEIANDNALTTGVKDATKDYPGVKAEVNNGEITLTGQIQRNKLPNLMQSLSSLKPKKINNQLTIK